jgi:hypothetical protein
MPLPLPLYSSSLSRRGGLDGGEVCLISYPSPHILRQGTSVSLPLSYASCAI